MSLNTSTDRSKKNDAHWLDVVGAICDGRATTDEQQAVAERIREDRDAQRQFVRYVDLHLSLLDPDLPEQLLDTNSTSDVASVAQIDPGTPRPPAPRFSRSFVISLPVAAAVLAIVIVPLAWITLTRSSPDKNTAANGPTGEVESVARLAETFRTRWADGRRLAIGTQFLPGRMIDLESGIVRLEIEGGAQMVIEGPSRFSIESPKLCKLEWGRVTVAIEGKATGFSVRTADADIVDMGTEFGIARSLNGSTQLEVFEGAVVVAAEDAAGEIRKVRFVKGELARVGADRVIEQLEPGDVKTRFARSIPRWEVVEVVNAGFEEAGTDPLTPAGWTTFGKAGGNLLRESSSAVLPRSGEHVAKLFGRFEDVRNFSGMYQEFPTESGQQWRVVAFIAHQTGDVLEGENRAFVKLDFVDERGEFVGGNEAASQLTAKARADVYLKSIVEATAPANTARVRVVVLFDQDDNRSPGAALFDDVSLFTSAPMDAQR